MSDQAPTGEQAFVTMTVGSGYFGVPVTRVRDVLDTPLIYPVPLAPPEIPGSINLRGRIVTAIDLRVRLGIPPRESADRCMCVIVEGLAGEPYALLVDEIGDVLTLPSSSHEANPITLSPTWSSMCRGLYRRDDSLLIVLDVEALLDLGSRAAA